MHEKYDKVGLDYDFAIIELEDPIDLSSESNARAACLPNPEDTNFNKDTKFTVSGWGYFDTTYNHPEKLKHAILNYCSLNTTHLEELCPTWCPTDSWWICATSSKGDASCGGDSGGRVQILL